MEWNLIQWQVFLMGIYPMIGFILTVYWNRDNDGYINHTIMFGWLLWPIFIVLFTPDFIKENIEQRKSKKMLNIWNKTKPIGTTIKYESNGIIEHGITTSKAFMFYNDCDPRVSIEGFHISLYSIR